MVNPDIIAVAAVSPDAKSAIVTVPLSADQAANASYGWVIEISPDDQAHWFFGASNASPSLPMQNRDGSTMTQHVFGAAASALPVPPTHVRVRLTNPSDPTLSPSIVGS